MFQLVSAAGNQNQGSSNNLLCASILHGLLRNNNLVPNISKPNLYVRCHVCSHCPDQLTSGLLCSVNIQQVTRVKQAHGLIRLVLLYKPYLQPLGLVHCVWTFGCTTVGPLHFLNFAERGPTSRQVIPVWVSSNCF